MTRTILVTGATGTVGSEVADDLRDRDDHVRVAVRDPDTREARFGDHDEVVTSDFERPETWGTTLADVDAVFLVRPPAVGLARLREFLNAAARVGVEHVVLLSLLGARRLPMTPHRRLERHIEDTAMAYTFLRASFLMRTLVENHREDIVEHDEIFVPAGGGTTSFVDARDVGAAAVALAEGGHEDRAYDVTGAEALDYVEVADAFTDVLGRPIAYPDPSIPEFIRRTYPRGQPSQFVLVTIGVYTTARLGLAGRVTLQRSRSGPRPAGRASRRRRRQSSRWVRPGRRGSSRDGSPGTRR